MAKRVPLGRDLNALLGGQDYKSSVSGSHKTDQKHIHELAVTNLSPGKYQPRLHMDEEQLSSLAQSIEKQGIIQPIVVRPLKDDRYEILAGERRWRAAQKAGLTHVPVVIKDITDKDALAVALVENIQREDLNPIEEAMALSRLIEEFSLTHQQVSELVGKNRSTVSNLLRLLTVDEWIQQKLVDGSMEMGHVRAILTLSPQEQRQMADRIIRFKLTVRDTEQWVQKQSISTKPSSTRTQLSDELSKAQKSLSRQLGLMVKIQPKRDGKGQMVIRYKDQKQLMDLIQQMQALAESDLLIDH